MDSPRGTRTHARATPSRPLAAPPQKTHVLFGSAQALKAPGSSAEQGGRLAKCLAPPGDEALVVRLDKTFCDNWFESCTDTTPGRAYSGGAASFCPAQLNSLAGMRIAVAAPSGSGAESKKSLLTPTLKGTSCASVKGCKPPAC